MRCSLFLPAMAVKTQGEVLSEVVGKIKCLLTAVSLNFCASGMGFILNEGMSGSNGQE
jgi:hypothetical protein